MIFLPLNLQNNQN